MREINRCAIRTKPFGTRKAKEDGSTQYLMNSTPSLLLLNISPRGERSGSRKLSDEYLTAWRAKNPQARIIVRDVGSNPPPVVSEAWIAGAFSPRDQHTTAMREAIDVSDAFVDELLAATEIVIATPIYNFNIPAALKL